MAIACDPQSLANAAACLDCGLTPAQNTQIALYAANAAAGGNATPQALVTAANCFNCLTEDQNLLVSLYVASKILSP